MPISTPELEAGEYKAPDISGIDVSKLPAPADVADIDLSGVSAPKKPEEQVPDYDGEMKKLIDRFSLGHDGPVKPEYVRDLVALHKATKIHPDLLHENKDYVPLAMKAAGRPDAIYTNEAERRAFIPEWHRAESELFADRTQKNDVAHTLDVLHIYGKYRQGAGGYLGLQGAWEAEAVSQLDKYALPKELFVSPGELKRTIGADTPKFLDAIGMPEQAWKLFERGNLPLPVPASALMGDAAQGYIPKLRDIAYGAPGDIPAPKLTLERAAKSVGEGAKRIAKDKVVGLQAGIDAMNRHDEALEKGGTPGPGESPVLPWVRDSMMPPEQRKQTRADTHATLGRIADGIELDPEYLNSSGFVEDLLKQTPQVAEQVLLALSTAGVLKLGKLPGLAAEAAKIGKAVSGGAMFSQIVGSKYQDLRAKGIDEDRAFGASFLDAALQTPMEQLGLGGILKGFTSVGNLGKKLLGIVEAAATEGVTEFSQQFVDDFTKILGERGEDEAAVYLARFMKNLPQTAKDGLYAALIGSVLGGAAHTAGIGVSAVQQRRMDAGQFNDVLKSVESLLKDMAPNIYEEVRTKPGDFETKEPGKEEKPAPATTEAAPAEPAAPMEEDGRSKAPAGYRIPEGRSIEQETAYVMAAMSHVESGGRYSAVNPYTGASGRYQYLQGTWEAYSKDYTRTLFQEARVLPQTPENQEAVTQFKVREFLEKGYSPKQIAAIWNSGQPNWAGKVGVNAKYGNRYDVPKYVADVDRAYQSIAQGKPVPVGRRDVAREIGQAKGITSEQVDKVMTVMDAAAASWAETYGRTSDEWYGATFAGFEEVGPEGLAQYAGRRAKGYVNALAEGKVFEGKYDLMERFEIPDQNMDLNIERAKKSPSGNEMLFTGALADLVKHDALYQNYPEIRNLRANILVAPNVESPSGAFGGDSIHVRAGNIEEAKDVIVHEIQHWVQQKEGFAKGSSPEYFEDQYKKLVGELKKWSEAIEKKLSTVTNRAEKRSLNIEKRDIEDRIADIEGQGVRALAAMDYLNTAGEIEARDTTARRRYGATERAQIPPYSEEGIRVKDAILLRQGRKGAVKFLEDGRAILSLFEQADVSTVIHELGHILRRQLSDADRMLIESWAGVDAGKWTREAEEKFARAFERYVMEGKAPTWKLRDVFAKLKKWLTDIYRTVKTLDVEISDDVRRVFDRLLTTEAQRNADVLYQMDDDYSWVEPAAEPIPLDSITEYEQVQAEAARRAHKVVERLIEKNRARREMGLRKDAEATLNEEPLWQLIQHVRKKGGVSIESVRANFGSDMVNALTRKYPGLLSKTGKMRLDELASEYGYEGDDALTQAMLDFPGKQGYVENAMEQMRKAFGFEEEADLLDWQERYIEEEIKILGELLGPSTEAWKNVPRPGVKKYIDKEIVGKALTGKEDTEYRSLVAAMRMSQRNAAIAFREGRKEGALTEKLRQRELAQRLKAKVAAKREVAKIQRDFKKWLKDKGIDWEYRQQLAALVAPYDLKRKNPSAKIVSLREFVARQEAEGEAVDLPQALLERLSKKPIGTLTLEELRELHEAAEQIVHLGKLKKKLVDRKRVRDFNAVKAKVIGTIMRRATKIGDIPEAPPTPSERRKGGKLARLVEKLDRQHTQLLQPEFLIRAFDGFEDMGTCYQELFLPVKQAEDEKWRLLEGIAQKWEEIRAPLKKQMRRWAKDRVEVPGLSRMLTREEHLMIALHARHEDNRAALVHGNKFTEAEINAVLASITPEEQTFLDRVVNELIPIPRDLLQDTYKNLYGRPLKMVQGDYVPMKFDREASDFIAEKRAEADAMNAFKQYFAGVFMEKGMTIERKGGKLPLHLGFSSIFEHLSDTVQFATHGLPVRNLLKLFSDRAFRDAVKVTHGENALDQLKPWLKEVASPGARPLLPLDGLMGTIRRNAVLYIMAYRMSTALQQPLALMQTMDELGVSRTLDAAGKFLFGKADTGQSWSEFVLGKSPAMRNRAQSFDRDLAAAMSGFDIDKSAWREGYERTAFALTAYMDGIAAQMTWLAAYQKAANGDAANVSVGDEAAAIDYADGVVNRTQGSGTAKNLAMVSRGTELHKVFVSFFYSFFSTYHNRLWEAYRKLRLPGYEYNALDAMKSFLLLVVIPGLLSEIASRGELPEKKEDLALSVGRYAASGLPLVRDAVSALTGYSYRGGLFGGMVNELGATAKAALSEKKKEKGWRIVKHSLKLGGYLTGLPPDQALIMLEAAMDPKNKRFTPDDLIWRERAERKKK